MKARPPLHLFNWPSHVGGALPAPSPWGEGWGEGAPPEKTHAPLLSSLALTLTLSPEERGPEVVEHSDLREMKTRFP